MRAMQQPIITALGVQAEIDASAEIEARIAFLADYLGSVPGIGGYVLGISGGQDSSLAGRLVQLAVERVRAAGQDVQFIAVRLPYGVQHDEDDAQLALEFIGADRVVTVNVAPAVDAMVDELVAATGEPVTDFNKGNIKARARMVAQYGIAGDRRMLVVGTDHAAEAVTGGAAAEVDAVADWKRRIAYGRRFPLRICSTGTPGRPTRTTWASHTHILMTTLRVVRSLTLLPNGSNTCIA